MSKVDAPLLARPAASGGPGEQDAGMHFRFEVNYIVDEITGAPPVVRILEIAWLEKRYHIRQFLLDYHRRHRALPRASHDLGITEIHHLPVGVIDFARVRERIRERLERRCEAGNAWSRLLARFRRGDRCAD